MLDNDANPKQLEQTYRTAQVAGEKDALIEAINAGYAEQPSNLLFPFSFIVAAGPRPTLSKVVYHAKSV